MSRLGVPDERPEVDGPRGEEEGEDVGGGERAEDDECVGEVERRDHDHQPERVEREEGPEVEARRPVPPPEQVHALHRLAAHLEPRHARRPQIGAESCEVVVGGVGRASSDRDSMRICEEGGVALAVAGVGIWVGFYRLGSGRRSRIGRVCRTAAAARRVVSFFLLPPRLLRCSSVLFFLGGRYLRFVTVRNVTAMRSESQ